MSDIVKIREWVDSDEPEPADGWEWPHPPICVRSRIQGDLRARILAKLGHPADSKAVVEIEESESEGGYSEYTIEEYHTIEVWVIEGRQSQKVFSEDDYRGGSPMAAFLKWSES